jgi:hypothetical protein
VDQPGYRSFTAALLARAAGDADVLGLVAQGSMAEAPRPPDAFSDHDFFLIVRPGTAERFRADPGWLPEPERIVFAFRETAHGVKALYDDGHLVEFAVFEPDELEFARTNAYRMLLDRAGLEERLVALTARTAAEAAATDPPWLAGQFLTALLVGVNRFRRGELTSAHACIRGAALGHLLRLLAAVVPPERPGQLDSLDPHRRIELAYPSLAAALSSVLTATVPAAARTLLELAEREVAPRLPHWPRRAAEVVAGVIAAAGR